MTPDHRPAGAPDQHAASTGHFAGTPRRTPSKTFAPVASGPANAVASPEQVGLLKGLTGRNMGVTLALVMVAFSVAPVYNHLAGYQNKDYNLWYWTGRTVLAGHSVYPAFDDPRPFPFMYPPACAGMLAIASVAGETPFLGFLLLLNSAAWIGSILLSVYLATGRSLRQHPLIYLVPTAVTVPFVHDMYLLGQPNLLLLLCMLGGFALLRIKRPWLAGTLFALAAAIKAFPFLAIGYLIYRRQVKATAAMLAALAFFMLLLPMPMRGAQGAWHDAVRWTRGMILKYDGDTIAQRPERSYSFKNQSLIALSNRLLRSIPADGESKDGWQVNIASLGFKEVNAFIVATALSLCLFYVMAMPRTRDRTDRSDSLERAMLLLLIMAFNPLSFDYSYVWLLFPVTLMVQLALEAPAGSRARATWVAGLTATVLLLAMALPFRRVSQAYGNLLVGGLLFLGFLGLELHRSTRAAANAEPASVEA
jgi:hypothetical protein